MNNNYLSNRILISLLKQYGIEKLVLSSGTRNMPFVTAVETDKDFDCYSVIDERSAAFFGLGLCQQTGQPVAIACTSGTAASNYLTGVTEAYYSHAPLIVITFDRSPYALEQLETQKIDQPGIFASVVKKSVTLPLIKDPDDAWYCQRILNEAFISLRRHRPGPIHINVPLVGDTNTFYSESIDYEKIDFANKIEYISTQTPDLWEEMLKKLSVSNRVLIVMGQTVSLSPAEKKALDAFASTFHCPILADNLANYRGKELIFAEAVIKGLNSKTIEPMLPEIVISFGNNFQERIKDLLKAHRGKFEHWSIDQEGVVRDVFKSQTALFECEPAHFFEYFAQHTDSCTTSCQEYLNAWRSLEQAIELPEMPFTNFYTIREFSKVIPNHSILHLSILNSTRLMQFFKLDESIRVYSNVNSFGIDGCLPTFMGQAHATDELAFIVIGDLSFFYGMNALAIKHRKNNIRVLLINNGGAAEFHIQPDSNAIPSIDWHIGAAHDRSAKGWAQSMGYTYLEARDQQSLADVLPVFTSRDQNAPIVLEVFTDMKKDGEFCLSVYREIEKQLHPVLERIK